MKNGASIIEEFNCRPFGELVVIGKLYREKFSDVMSEAAFAQAISRLCRSGKIERVSKGIYCLPKKSRFGTVLPSDRDIVELYTKDGSGVAVGYAMYNMLGVTTQISKCQTLYSSLPDERLKQIGNVTIRKYDLKYTQNIKSIIQIMELLRHYNEIQDVNVSAVIKSIEKYSKEYNENAFETVQNTIGYPKRTIAFLREALNYYHIPNSLSNRLSALSNYRIPRMEELYEFARKQN